MSINIYDMKFFQFLGFHKKPKAPWAKYYDKKDAWKCLRRASAHLFLLSQFCVFSCRRTPTVLPKRKSIRSRWKKTVESLWSAEWYFI